MPSENMPQESPSGEFQDDSYISRSGEKNQPMRVVSDQEAIDDPINEETADTDEQLGKSKSYDRN
jgi:hypothetical protein